MKKFDKASRQNSYVAQSGAARIAPLFAILLTIALAALAAPQNRDHDRDRGGDWDRDRAISVSHERMAQDFGGGRGGRPSGDAVCGDESVAVGFHVQTGEYFNTA